MKPTDNSNRTEQATINFVPARAFPQLGGLSRRQFLQVGATVGFGVTAVLLYMFTTDNLRHYGALKAMGATSRQLLGMIFAQAGACAFLGTGLGLGACAVVGPMVAAQGFPFRMMWFTPLLGGAMVILVSTSAALLSARPALRLEPAAAFAGR